MTETNPAPLTPPEPATAYWSGIATAVGLDIAIPLGVSIAMNVLMIPFTLAGIHRTPLYVVTGIPGLLTLGIGVSQWLWLVPAARRARAKGRPEYAKGIISGGWMVFILNASCWGLLGGMLFLNR